MPKTITKETTAIVLGSQNHSESDKIVTFYSRERGKITGIAKGANKSKKRFLNKLEPFSYINLDYSEKQSTTLIFINEVELLASFMQLRCDVDRYICACFIIETTQTATTEGQVDVHLFKLLCWCLYALAKGKNRLTICAIFLIRLFDYLGYRPDFNGCWECKQPLSPKQKYDFHYLAGGLLCAGCIDKTASRRNPISIGTIRILDSILAEPLNRLHRLHFSKPALYQSMVILNRYGRNLFQRETQSWKAIVSLFKQADRFAPADATATSTGAHE